MSDDMYNVLLPAQTVFSKDPKPLKVLSRSNDKEVSTSIHNDVVSRRDLKYGPYFEPIDYVS